MHHYRLLMPLLFYFIIPCISVAAEPLLPVAEFLVNAPVNATWAANHPAYWQERGLGGLILHTRLAEIPASDAPGMLIQEEQRFLEELQTALRRLKEIGLDKNFLYVALAPEANYFTDRDNFKSAVQHIKHAADIAEALGMQGLCLDVRTTSLHFDFRFDGFSQPMNYQDTLRQAAKDLGARLIANAIQSFPNAEIILYADAPEVSGALSFALLNGCVAGVGAADTVKLHLSLPLGPADSMPGLYKRASSTAALQKLRSESGYDSALKGAGAIAWRISPVGRDTRESTLSVAPDKLVPFLCATKTLSSDYAVLDIPKGGWWQITAEEAGQYTHLLQGGEGVVAPTLGVSPALQSVSWKTPIDGKKLVSELAWFAEGPASVFTDAAGAALLFWEGVEDRIKILQRERLIKMTELETLEEEYIKPRFGRLLVPRMSEAVLVEGMSIRDWAMPNAIQFELHGPLQENRYRVNTTLDIQNPFDFPLEAQLEYLAPGYASFGGASVPVNLAPGQGKSHQRLLQGRWTVQDAPNLGASLLFPGGTPIVRSENFPVYPELRWQYVLNGACVGAPLLHHWLDPEKASIVACGENGEMLCFSPEGQVQWERQTPNRLVNGAVAAAGPSAFVFTMDHRGEIRGFDEEGTLAFNDRLPVPPLAHTLHYAASLDFQLGDLIVAALSDGRMWSKPLQGDVWEYHFDGQNCFIAPGLDTANMPYDTFSEKISRQLFVADGRDDGLLTCFDFQDGLFWQRELDGPPTCMPIVVRGKGEERHRILTASGEGLIEVWQAETAKAIDSAKTVSRLPVFQLAYGDIHPSGGYETFAVDSRGIHCLSSSLRPIWECEIAAARFMVLVPEKMKTRWIAADAQGKLFGGDAEGKILWTDDRAIAPLSGAPIVVRLPGGKEWLCVSASRDGAVRAIVIPR